MFLFFVFRPIIIFKKRERCSQAIWGINHSNKKFSSTPLLLRLSPMF